MRERKILKKISLSKGKEINMETNQIELRSLIESINARNKRLETPFAERLVEELQGVNSPSLSFYGLNSEMGK
jgi:hypothetical protein